MHYNISIIGGGMVGLSLACALHLKLPNAKIVLIDAAHSLVEDKRLIALTYGSCNFFKNLHIWPFLENHATPIKQIHVSQKGHFGITRITAQDLQLESLGHLIPAKYINAALEEKIKDLKNVTVIRPANVTSVTTSASTATPSALLKILRGVYPRAQRRAQDDNDEITTDIIIAADGTNSTVRELLNIPTQTIDYDQSAIVTTTFLQRSHNNIAYERFQDKGAIAMLPLSENQTATIWTTDNKQIQELLKLDDDNFLKTLQSQFGYRLGKFTKIGARHTYPLKLVIAKQQQKDNVILIGNAAHTVHPIAAQGLNVALNEIAQLVAHAEKHWLCGDFTYIGKPISGIDTQLSHHLTELFSSKFFMLNFARQLGMIGLDVCPSIKNFIMRKAMGRDGQIPRLLLERDTHEIECTG